MKKILKALIYLLVLLIFFSIYEFTSIDSRYVNRSTIDIDINKLIEFHESHKKMQKC